MTFNDREVLEAALIEDFHDRTTHHAYADLLMEQGDPRGEYIQWRLQLEDPDLPIRERRQLEQRATQRFLDDQGDWLGDLAPFLIGRRRGVPEPDMPNYEFAFQRGWLTELDIRDVRHAFTQVLAEAAPARLLQRLTLRNTRLRNNERVLEPLTHSTYLGAVRSFQLGDPEEVIPTGSGDRVGGVLERMPRLEELTLYAVGVDADTLFQRPFPRLRKLVADFLPELPLARLGENPTLTHLQRLCLREVAQQEGVLPPGQLARIPPVGLDRFFQSPHLGALRHLELRMVDVGGALCRSLALSPMLGRLETLSLCDSEVTDVGINWLLRSGDWAQLRSIDLRGNTISDALLRAIGERGVQLDYYPLPRPPEWPDEL